MEEIVLGGSCRGVPLHTAVFDEPGTQNPLSANGGARSREERWARAAARRDARFEAVYSAIDRLILYAKHERNLLMTRLLGVPPRPPRKTPVAQCQGLPPCSEVPNDGDDDGEVSADGDEDLVDVDKQTGCARKPPDEDKEGSDHDDHPQCFFAPKRHRRQPNAGEPRGSDLADQFDDDFCVDKKS